MDMSEGAEFRYFMPKTEYDAIAKHVDPMMSKDDPLLASGTRSMWFGVVKRYASELTKELQARLTTEEAERQRILDCNTRQSLQLANLRAENERLREESARRNASADGWNEKACELEREARTLRAENERLKQVIEAQP